MKPSLENIKAGDMVIVNRYLSPRKLAKVERVTPTQIVLLGCHYRKKDGCQPGGSYSSSYITYATRDEIEEILKEERIRKVYNHLKNLKLNEIDYKQALVLSDVFGIK